MSVVKAARKMQYLIMMGQKKVFYQHFLGIVTAKNNFLKLEG